MRFALRYAAGLVQQQEQQQQQEQHVSSSVAGNRVNRGRAVGDNRGTRSSSSSSSGSPVDSSDSSGGGGGLARLVKRVTTSLPSTARCAPGPRRWCPAPACGRSRGWALGLGGRLGALVPVVPLAAGARYTRLRGRSAR
ncbi:X-linked retinitis pigmentosa GTPase regulator-interacting protein 1 [Frankliniella fusca]|uniref:X-linked retinitis pigmentosa GTPase regulator-interacting protein 1 n=1 Tax=Frankliniella fusca TaxID=407009 RepID=A0AAE1I7Q6_9NEOP|nr:X-linked retinitis pigmentosa GTPase regulator-interacting protein 1 [Frankliniella fusca]